MRATRPRCAKASARPTATPSTPRGRGAAVVAAALAVLALGWVALLRRDRTGPSDGLDALRSDLGLPMALFVISLCPGIFEELAFRGIIQPRLALHFGRTPAHPWAAPPSPSATA